MSSILTLNYFKSPPSFPIVDFEQVNICEKIISRSIRLISLLMCLLEEGRTKQEAMQGILLFFLFPTLSEM